MRPANLDPTAGERARAIRARRAAPLPILDPTDPTMLRGSCPRAEIARARHDAFLIAPIPNSTSRRAEAGCAPSWR